MRQERARRAGAELRALRQHRGGMYPADGLAGERNPIDGKGLMSRD